MKGVASSPTRGQATRNTRDSHGASGSEGVGEEPGTEAMSGSADDHAATSDRSGTTRIYLVDHGRLPAVAPDDGAGVYVVVDVGVRVSG
jgi:hypothetical protein